MRTTSRPRQTPPGPLDGAHECAPYKARSSIPVGRGSPRLSPPPHPAAHRRGEPRPTPRLPPGPPGAGGRSTGKRSTGSFPIRSHPMQPRPDLLPSGDTRYPLGLRLAPSANRTGERATGTSLSGPLPVQTVKIWLILKFNPLIQNKNVICPNSDTSPDPANGPPFVNPETCVTLGPASQTDLPKRGARGRSAAESLGGLF